MWFSVGELDLLSSSVRDFVKSSFLSLKAEFITRKGGDRSGLCFLTKPQCPRMAGTSKNHSLTATTEHPAATEGWCFAFLLLPSLDCA